jgi:2-aminoadipate transaminase
MFEDKLSYLGNHLQGSEIRRLFATSMRPNVISFAGGLPDPASFPKEKVAEILSKLLTEKGEIYLQYGGSKGNAEGIEAVLFQMKKRKIISKPENIIITSGSQQAVDIMTKILIDPGDTILVEDPTFVGALGVFRNYQANIEGITLLEDGIDLDQLLSKVKTKKKIKFFYLIPNFHNPSGLTMSIEKRKKVLEIAREYDFLILEDDPYGELYFSGGLEGVQPIKSFDREGRVVYTSSFSKTISPGVRLAWVEALPEMIDRFDMAKQMLDVCSNPLMQGLAWEMCRSGFLDKHIEKLRSIYRSRAKAMLAALKKHMPENVRWTVPKGGFYIWLTLPQGVDTLDMLKSAIEQDVVYVVGSAFSPSWESKNCLRISFCHETEEVIAEGIKRLANSIKSYLS